MTYQEEEKISIIKISPINLKKEKRIKIIYKEIRTLSNFLIPK